MDAAAAFRRTAATVNRAMLPALRTSAGRAALGRWFAVITYVGRRSGRELTLPVNYTRKGDVVTIRVAAPQAKTWWRNFLGAGAPMRLLLGSTERDAHATAVQDERGRVVVTARLA